MKWVVSINDKQVVVEAKYGISSAGEVLVDGKIAKAWGSSLLGLPKEVAFEVEGKPAFLRRRGVVHQGFDLLVDGKLARKA